MAIVVWILILSFGCIVADYLFPRLRPVEKFIRSLPLGGREK